MSKNNFKLKSNYSNLGFTLVEFILAILFSFIIFDALIRVTLSTSNQLVDENNRRLATNYMNLALDMLIDDINLSTSLLSPIEGEPCDALQLLHSGNIEPTTYSCDINRGLLKDGIELIPFEEYYSDLATNNKLQIEKFQIEKNLIENSLISSSSEDMRENTYKITLTVKILDINGEKVEEIKTHRQIFHSNGYIS